MTFLLSRSFSKLKHTNNLKCNRLQQGMRGAFGKPTGKVARVNIDQVLVSVRTKDNNKAVVYEALRRCKYKFAGRQKMLNRTLSRFGAVFLTKSPLTRISI
jgi:ribosomal protein L16/L10AE